jgi:hypothetical protein
MTNIPKPNRPKTIEGTPARLRIARRTKRMSLPSRAYSLRYTAELTPTARARLIAPATSSSVPAMHGQMPPAE